MDISEKICGIRFIIVGFILKKEKQSHLDSSNIIYIEEFKVQNLLEERFDINFTIDDFENTSIFDENVFQDSIQKIIQFRLIPKSLLAPVNTIYSPEYEQNPRHDEYYKIIRLLYHYV